MKLDLIIRGGKVVTEQGVYNADIAVKDGKIAGLADWGLLDRAEEEIDATGKLILPGGVDPHVHLNEPGRGDWEGWEHGTRAAAAAGVTTILEMPLNCTPPIINTTNWEAKQEVARKLACVDYALWGGLVDDNLKELDGLSPAALGIPPFVHKKFPYGLRLRHSFPPLPGGAEETEVKFP